MPCNTVLRALWEEAGDVFLFKVDYKSQGQDDGFFTATQLPDQNVT